MFIEIILVFILMVLLYSLSQKSEKFITEASEYRKNIISKAISEYEVHDANINRLDSTLKEYDTQVKTVVSEYNRLKCAAVPYYKLDNNDISQMYFDDNGVLNVKPIVQYGIPKNKSAHNIHDIVLDTKQDCEPVDDYYREEIFCEQSLQKCKGEYYNNLEQYGGIQENITVDGVNMDVCSYEPCKQFCYDQYDCWVQSESNIIKREKVDICLPNSNYNCINNPIKLCPKQYYLVHNGYLLETFEYKQSLTTMNSNTVKCEYDLQDTHISSKIFQNSNDYDNYLNCMQNKRKDPIFCHTLSNDGVVEITSTVVEYDDDNCSYSNITNGEECLIQTAVLNAYCPIENYNFTDDSCGGSNLITHNCSKEMYEIEESWIPISDEGVDDYTRSFIKHEIPGDIIQNGNMKECVFPSNNFVDKPPDECIQTCWGVDDRNVVAPTNKTGNLNEIDTGYECVVPNCKTYDYITSEIDMLNTYQDMLNEHRLSITN